MAYIKLAVVPAKILKNGKHKIRISLSHASNTRYIPTDCIIDDLTQFKDGQVVNNDNAACMNKKLRTLLNHYQTILDEVYDINVYSCSELINILIKKKSYTNVKLSKVVESYLSELQEDKRIKSEKLYRLACNSFFEYRGDIVLATLNPRDVKLYKLYLEEKGLSPTTIRIYLTLFKVVVNYAIKHRMVIFEEDPFEFLTLPKSNIREIDITKEELKKIRDVDIDNYRINIARDIFMLSYYLGGINLVDMLEIDFRKPYIEYYRSKTKNKKQGESKTSFSIQPEASEIIKKYMKKNGKLQFGKFDTFSWCYSVVATSMQGLADIAGIKKRVIFYSARKSFVQHGFELGISLEILEYCIGQSMKTNRPIFNYFRVMRDQADTAMRKIFDQLL